MKRQPLSEVPPHTIVRWRGLWGVVIGPRHQRWRTVDFWGGPAEVLPWTARVDVPERQKA